MKTYHLGYDRQTLTAHVRSSETELPKGVLSLGSFRVLDEVDQELGEQDTRTIFHEVRDKLSTIGERFTGQHEIMLA